MVTVEVWVGVAVGVSPAETVWDGVTEEVDAVDMDCVPVSSCEDV